MEKGRGEWKIRTNFREKYKLLCKLYHEKYDEDICKEYYERLKKHGNMKIDKAFSIAIDSLKFFPTIAELNDIIAKLPPIWFYQNLETEKLTPEESEEMERLLSKYI